MSDPKTASSRPTDRRSRAGASGHGSGSFVVAPVKVQELATLAGNDVESSPAEDLLSDELIVERVLAGERHLYPILVRRHSRRIYRIARAVLGVDTDLEGALVETFLSAYAQLAGFDRAGRFALWLAELAVKVSLVRLQRFADGTEEEFLPPPSRPAQPSMRMPEASPSDRELAGLLEAGIDALPLEQRSVFALHAFDELNAEDIAECLSVDAELIKLQLFRARLRLRRLLRARLEGPQELAFHLSTSRTARVADVVTGRLNLKPTH
jgi:RNA polymerase sigma-70 factor (ECF subfamily)